MPRFQFSLRTLMVAVTLLAVALGCIAPQVRVVWARNAWIDAHVKGVWGGSSLPHMLATGDRSKTPSALRVWLGDYDQRLIEVPHKISQAELNEVTSLFPEATIYWDSFSPLSIE